jgi:hypothetical protein
MRGHSAIVSDALEIGAREHIVTLASDSIRKPGFQGLVHAVTIRLFSVIFN